MAESAGVLEDHFGQEVAGRYDDAVGEMFDPVRVEPAIDFLAGLADGGPALELGIGTGRLALPLAARGVAVHGVDLSSAMVERLRAKPGGAEIPITIGDFASTKLTETFRLAYLVFNTVMNLTTAEQQVACFQNVAAHLEVGGRFVIEVSVPQLQRLPPGETVRAFDVSDDHLGFDEYDTASQRLVSHHFSKVNGNWKLRSIPFRYVWPSELDLMARLAGMKLCERWGGWQRDPFTDRSVEHISVWQKTAP